MDKRYQVFISSTYSDLAEERNQVVKALLELDCIPCGMEYFPSNGLDQWQYIKKLIVECDYYVLILGGRYGSLAKDGKSYTQKEYEFAVKNNIPTIALIHSAPDKLTVDKSEKDPKNIVKLNKFRNLVKEKLVRFWSNKYELAGITSRSLIQMIKEQPRPGWIHAESIGEVSFNPTEEYALHNFHQFPKEIKSQIIESLFIYSVFRRDVSYRIKLSLFDQECVKMEVSLSYVLESIAKEGLEHNIHYGIASKGSLEKAEFDGENLDLLNPDYRNPKGYKFSKYILPGRKYPVSFEGVEYPRMASSELFLTYLPATSLTLEVQADPAITFFVKQLRVGRMIEPIREGTKMIYKFDDGVLSYQGFLLFIENFIYHE